MVLASPNLRLKLCHSYQRQRGTPGCETNCSLVINEIAVRKQVEFANTRYHGYVDIGNGEVHDSAPMAKDALAWMAVSANAGKKKPSGYFVVDGLSGKERVNFVRGCLHRLHNVGVTTVSSTCKGQTCHISKLTDLGASMHPDNLTLIPSSSRSSDGNSSLPNEGGSASQVSQASVELAGYGSVVWPDSISEWLVDGAGLQ